MRRTSRSVVAAIEFLENRRLLSSVTLSGSTLKIIGNEQGVGPNDGNDRLLITRDNAGTDKYVVRLNGVVQQFNVSRVNLIRISTLGGDDEIEISSETGTIQARRQITAGNGQDTILSTGGGGETLRGSSGNDVIRAGDGTDIIEGNGGRDRLYGESGADHIVGNSGDDTIRGGIANDSLYGDAGDDRVFGEDGSDILGGDAEDHLAFAGQPAPRIGVGDDALFGGAGDDILLAHEGSDTLTGGRGDDLFDARDDSANDADDDTLVDRNDNEVVPSEAVFGGTALDTRTISLQIRIGDQDVAIPAGAGEFDGPGNSFAIAVDDNGVIHFRDRALRDFTLGEFFQAWGVTFDSSHVGRFIEDSGLTLRMTVDGAANTQYGNYEIQDGEEIVITLS